MLLQQLSDNEDQHRNDDQHEQSGDADQKSRLLLPIGQGCHHRRRRDDRNRKIAQCASRSQPVTPVNQAGQTPGPVIRLRQNRSMHQAGFETSPDHLFNVGIAGQQRSVAVIHGNTGVLPKRHGCEELLEVCRGDRSGDEAEKLALRTGDLERDDGSPAAGETALHQFD